MNQFIQGFQLLLLVALIILFSISLAQCSALNHSIDSAALLEPKSGNISYSDHTSTVQFRELFDSKSR